MKTIKYIISLAVLGLYGICAVAQNGVNAPYSQYGIGINNQLYVVPASASFGGANITRAGNNFVNPFTPASYAAIEKESFVFDMGFRIEMSTQKDPGNSLYDADGNIGYIAVGFPLTKVWKTAFAILPMSDVSYKSTQTVPTPGGEVKTNYEGFGGVSRMIWGHAFNITKQLSVGCNFNFLYGSIDRGISYSFTDSLASYMDSRRQKTTSLKNFTFDFGAQYFQPIGKDYQLGLGVTLATPQTLNVMDKALAYTFVVNGGNEYMRDTIFPGVGEDAEYASVMEQPMQVGLGLSFQRNNHWLIALDGNFAPWSGFKYNDPNNMLGATAVDYDFCNNFRGAIGAQLLGDLGASHYVRRITWSAGFHYESGKLCLRLADGSDPVKLDEWGLGFGVTLPMRKGKSLLNISAAYSSFGSVDLLRHNCFTIGLSVSSCESWFVKRKYN